MRPGCAISPRPYDAPHQSRDRPDRAAQLELRELPVPEIAADSALLRVEACGICGSDAEQYTGTIPVRYPLVPGHEPLGVIEAIGDLAAKRWGVDVGDRVAVEALIPCGHCPACRGGRYQVCRGRGRHVRARVRAADASARPVGRVRRLHVPRPAVDRAPGAPDMPPGIAVLFNPLGAGFRWAVELPRTGPGDTVLVLGPGQRGLASVIAARAAGADRIIVTGLTRDAAKLALALELGADHVIDVEREDAGVACAS